MKKIILLTIFLLIGLVLFGCTEESKINTDFDKIEPTTGQGAEQTFNYLCLTLDSNTFVCGCYEGTEEKGGANRTLCCAESDELLKKNWNCS
jgi:hypothetical protein